MRRAQHFFFAQVEHLAGNITHLPHPAHPARCRPPLATLVGAQVAVGQVGLCFEQW
jgi:hypothetical protein